MNAHEKKIATLHVAVWLYPMMMQLLWQRTIFTLAVTSNINLIILFFFFTILCGAWYFGSEDFVFR